MLGSMCNTILLFCLSVCLFFCSDLVSALNQMVLYGMHWTIWYSMLCTHRYATVVLCLDNTLMIAPHLIPMTLVPPESPIWLVWFHHSLIEEKFRSGVPSLYFEIQIDANVGDRWYSFIVLSNWVCQGYLEDWNK